MGRWPCGEIHFASLPVVVVLPEPCRPTIIHMEGGRDAKFGLACLPSSRASSSRTILITCWSGESWSRTSEPSAFSRICARNSSITPTLTSPSSSASRIPASASSTCSCESFPWPRRFLKTRCSLSVRFSNICLYPDAGLAPILYHYHILAGCLVMCRSEVKTKTRPLAIIPMEPLLLSWRFSGVDVGTPHYYSV